MRKMPYQVLSDILESLELQDDHVSELAFDRTGVTVLKLMLDDDGHPVHDDIEFIMVKERIEWTDTPRERITTV